MRDLEFIRDYPVEVQRLWKAVTTPVQLVQWFGPEGIFIDECDMDFRSTGPWWCAMRGKESHQEFKVSGQVTNVSPPEDGRAQVSFTWAWHDETGTRGRESFVTFSVEATTHGARLTLSHRELADTKTAQDHTAGWLSTLRKLDLFFGNSMAEREI